MLNRNVIACNRDQACQSRFGRQQIVVRIVRRERLGVITDGEELPSTFVEKAEVHLRHEIIRLAREALQPVVQISVYCGKCEAGLAHGDEMTGEITTVHRADVRRIEHAQIGEIVPVVEVAAILPHAGERRERLLEPFGHVGGREQLQVAGADRRHELQAHVGRRCAHRHHRHGVSLKVVWRQPVRVGGDECVEKCPVQLRIAQRRFASRRRKFVTLRFGWRTDSRHDPRRDHPAHQQQPDDESGQLQICERQAKLLLPADSDGEHRDGECGDKDHTAAHRTQRERPRVGDTALHQLRRLPLQHQPMRHVQPIQRADDCVERHDRLMRQREHSDKRLFHAYHCILCDCLVVRTPRLVERRPHDRQQQCRDPRRDHGPNAKQRPAQGGAWQNRPAANQKQQLRDLDGAAPQVVDDLPLRHQRQAVAFGAIGPGHRASQPRQQLPVAADPSMFAAC